MVAVTIDRRGYQRRVVVALLLTIAIGLILIPTTHAAWRATPWWAGHIVWGTDGTTTTSPDN